MSRPRLPAFLASPLTPPSSPALRVRATLSRLPTDNRSTSRGGEVTLTQLMDHTGLGMHYVNGVPLGDKFPSAGLRRGTL